MARLSTRPTGTVTFLFTDIEGSTRMWDETPEAMAKALSRHDEILWDTVESHFGVVFKHTGEYPRELSTLGKIYTVSVGD